VQRLSFLPVAALFAAALVVPLRAHELPYDVVAYVRVDPAAVHVLVRVPMSLLADARLPTRFGGYIDLPAADAPLAAVASEIARNLDLMHNGRPLPMPAATLAVTRRPDAAFDSYDAALARFSAPRLPADTPVDPGIASVDVRLEYPSVPADSRLSIRVNGFRARTRAVRMLVHDVRSNAVRTFVMSGAPRRVDLEPGWQGVAPIFARLGLEQLALSTEHLLFLLCLAIPPRRVRNALLAFGAFAAGHALALLMSSLMPGPPDLSRTLTVHALVAGALIIVALQNITEPRFAWIRVAAVVFGVLDGLSFGFAYREGLPLAGSHTFTSLVSFAVPVLLASLWLLLIAQPVVGLLYRSKLPERWAILCLSAIPIHAGLHGIVQLGAP
jgi:hypothetical protein